MEDTINIKAPELLNSSNEGHIAITIELLPMRLFIDELGFGGYYGEMDKLVQLGNYYKTTGDKEIVYRDRVVETTVIDGISIDKIKDLLKVVGTYTDNPTLLRKHVSDYAELEEKYKNKENEKEEVKKEVERWKRDNAKTLENLNTANNELAISKEAVRTLTNNISLNLNPEIDGLKKDLEDKEKELAQSKLREEELKKTSVNTEAVEKEKELTTANNRLTRQNKA
ncbi:10339_t:CDS:2 [Funneliformis geosporum]|nr:10339_t:CDS:2 [Funneliformis geosporum]